jgi:hypothetical protein
MAARNFALRRINPMLLQHGIILEVSLAGYSSRTRRVTAYDSATIDWEVTFPDQVISPVLPDMSR